MSRFCLPVPLSLLLVIWLALPGLAQEVPYSFERPGGLTSDPLEQPRDVTGRSVKLPRVRALHDADGTVAGSAGWMVKHDPWVAYAWGRELALREFSAQEGAFGESGRLAGTTLEDQSTPMMSRGHVNSCAACHNVPWRDMGAGITIAKNSSAGRNTPHLFGAGVVEMVGQEVRRQLLAQADRDGNGWISLKEARQAGPAQVQPVEGQTLDFGSFADLDGDDRPDLDPVVYVWYVDAQGQRISWARSSSDDPGVAGYNFSVQVFGHGQNDRIGHGGLGDTLRSVAAKALDMHAGLQAFDPTCNNETRAGLTGVSLAGAQQFFTGFSRDLGQVQECGVSRDDPDRDGIFNEISEGDLDLLEWFLLNHPTPSERPSKAFVRGRQVANEVGCFACHTPDWHLPNDRRFFELTDHLQLRSPGPNTVRGVYSDFRQHDLGPAFHELQFDGTVRTHFRTPPLWGVATSMPYGHDGASLSLEEVILRHQGEAEEVTSRFRRLPEDERDDLLAFLGGLVLRSTDRAADVDGDGRISQHFMVAGMDTGVERFNPEWFFLHPGRIEGRQVNAQGVELVSQALTNLREAYGLDLPGLLDTDRDGFADR
ncbi:MAG: di-heme oxidoredictase family protein [Vulcanimicrobiota bacterium]